MYAVLSSCKKVNPKSPRKANERVTAAFLLSSFPWTQPFSAEKAQNPAAGQVEPAAPSGENQGMTTRRPQMERDATAHRISNIMGPTVKNDRGEQLGEIEDIVIDEQGRVQYLILSHGGLLHEGSQELRILMEKALHVMLP